MTDLLTNPLSFLYWLGALVIAITIHEFAHAAAADHLGDPTPRLQGRLTLNPLSHLDPLGTIMLVLVHFGWGRPVVFDPFNLRHPRRDAAVISLAGPAANLLLAIVCAIVLQLLFVFRLPVWQIGGMGLVGYLMAGFLKTLVTLNVVLAVFNLIPIHPLDGFKIVGGMLPKEHAGSWYELESYGMLFLLFLLLPIFGETAPVARIISPIVRLILLLLLPAVPLT
jgi:Zn-dependent protease